MIEIWYNLSKICPKIPRNNLQNYDPRHIELQKNIINEKGWREMKGNLQIARLVPDPPMLLDAVRKTPHESSDSIGESDLHRTNPVL